MFCLGYLQRFFYCLSFNSTSLFYCRWSKFRLCGSYSRLTQANLKPKDNKNTDWTLFGIKDVLFFYAKPWGDLLHLHNLGKTDWKGELMQSEFPPTYWLWMRGWTSASSSHLIPVSAEEEERGRGGEVLLWNHKSCI